MDTDRLTLPELTRRIQVSSLPLPLQNPSVLPLSSLEPEVFERLVTEIISRRNNLGTQFYGRRGQKQYGLDIVEREHTTRRTLYQVKRYQTLTGSLLREAVTDYAGAPRTRDYRGDPRIFDPRRFVVVSSATLDADTDNIDTLAALQDEYEGDLEIDAWGSEALSRMLRDQPNVVFAVFGPLWSKAFCGFDPGPSTSTMPKALGFVEDPVSVLGLDSYRADAEAAQTAGDSLTVGRLLGVVANGLSEGNFPAHAAAMRRRQAQALREGGDHDSAFAIISDLAVSQLLAGWSSEISPLLHELEQLAAMLGTVRSAEHTVLEQVARWYANAGSLNVSVPALRELAAAQIAKAGLLTCLVIEQALVDGMYDWLPARPLIAVVDENSDSLLAELRDLAANSDCADPVVRARLRCAVADASLTLDATPSAVDAIYRQIVDDALAGRLLHARGLVTSRAARAAMISGDHERASVLWRQSILASSEDGYYGDTRGAIRASGLTMSDRGILQFLGPAGDMSSLPNRQRLLAAAFDPALAALEAAHHDKLTDAFGDARRCLWECRLAGHLQDELHALSLFGDVLAAAGHATEAVEIYVHGGADDKAVAHSKFLSGIVDVHRWTSSGLRARRAAAIQLIKTQANTVPDGAVKRIVNELLDMAAGVWTAPWYGPRPEIDALNAIAQFGLRIPESAADVILKLAQPSRHLSTLAGDTMANLLVQTYWAAPSRRVDIAETLADMLRLNDPPPSLWGLVASIPTAASGPLRSTVLTLATQNHEQAIETLAAWRIPTVEVQRRARQACAALLRRPIGRGHSQTHIGSQESATVDLLLSLADATDIAEISLADLSPDIARPAGGILMSFAVVTAIPSTIEPEPTQLEVAKTTSTDTAAQTAASTPEQLLRAVAGHMASLVKDATSSAASRLQTLHALRQLARRIPPEDADNIIQLLVAVHNNPEFSDTDLSEIASNSPLSAMKFNSGAHHLPGLALLTAAELFAVTCTSVGAITDQQRKFAHEVAASAARQLCDSDQESRNIGALTAVALASATPEFVKSINALLYHPDERVRAHGAAYAPIELHMASMLASDPSPTVRAALATRDEELPEHVRISLAQDPHAVVRHNLARERNPAGR